MPFTFYVLSPLAIVGLFLAARDAKRCSPLYLMIVAGVALGVLAAPFSRYRVPYEAAMIPFGALTVSTLVAWIEARRWRHVAALALLTAALFAWTSRPIPRRRTLIRRSDYTAPLNYFWGPRIERARSAEEAVAIYEEALEYQPPEIAALASHPRGITWFQAELSVRYADIYDGYARALAAAGRTRESAKARDMADFLAVIARGMSGNH